MMEFDYDDYGYDLFDDDMYDDYNPMMHNYMSDEDILQQLLQQEPHQTLAFTEVIDQCVKGTLHDAGLFTLPLVGMCFVTHLSTIMLRGEESFIHLIAICSGLTCLFHFFHVNMIYIVVLAALGYIIMILSKQLYPKHLGIAMALACFFYLVICELLLVDPSEWHRVRGAQMVLAMKLISLGFDIDLDCLPSEPNILEFFAYLFNVGTVIFGPWINFTEYIKLLYSPGLSLSWMVRVIKSLILAYVCLIVSACLIHWLLPSYGPWWTAYKDAQSFRFSHYFICYISEATLITSGLGARVNTDDKVEWEFSVVNPFHIELPRSLVDVVTWWNVPMHNWLKTYVFKTARPLGTFFAVLLTYAASSLLHGLNFQLAAVLLSLGFYSYIEHVLREKLSVYFRACIQARACKKECNHDYKKSHLYVIITNVVFTALSVWHLAYLGFMFDSSPEQERKGYSMDHTLEKWSNLNYLSHWVAGCTYVFYLLI